MLTKKQIGQNLAETMQLMDEFPRGEAPAQKAALKIARHLNEMGIAYVMVGGLAVGAHGHKRATVDVDLILSKADLARFKERWLGLGWVEKFKGSKGLRDAEFNVKVDILTTDEIPGDGKTAPFTFPDPATVATEIPGFWAGVRVIDLPNLMTLKIVTGMTVPKRPGDYDDAMRLIEANNLPREFGKKLHPFVRAKYDELWLITQTPDPKPEA